jgi:predicted outer membrane repeat protein
VLLCFSFTTLPSDLNARTGGPDAYGYTFTDSNEVGGPDFKWIDITSTGRELLTAGDDVASSPVELGFPVVLYGVIQTNLVATSNGYLSTDPAEKGVDATPDCPLPAVPSEGRGTRIYALHDDLTLDSSSAGVYYQYFKLSPHPHSKMGVSVFTWDNLRFDNGSAFPLNFQVLLFDDGDILLQYDTSGLTWGGSSTVGLVEDGTRDGILYMCTTPGAITDGLAVAFSPPTIEINSGLDAFNTPSGLQVTLREALRDIPSGGRIVLPLSLSGDVMNLASNFGSLEIPDGKAVHIDPGDLDNGALIPFEVTGRRLNDPIFAVGEDALLTIRGMRLTAADGGSAVRVDNRGYLRMQGCLIRDCESSGEGGAVDFNGQTGLFVNCEFDSNTATNGGGAIASDSSSLICVISSTFYDNKAGTYGGAIYARDALEILNSTIAHNQAGLDGGALHCGNARLEHNTIVSNLSSPNGSGIRVQSGNMEMGHTILAKNLGNNIKLATGGSFTSLGHNLSDGDFAAFNSTNDLTETDPKLAPLGHYGGGLPSCLPLAGSPVIDGGIYAANPPGLNLDQRGFQRVEDGDKSGIALIDIGAVESQDYIVVTTSADENNSPAGANVSLREAIRDADFESGQQIRIDPSLSGDTLDLSSLGPLFTLPFAIIDGSLLSEPLKLTTTSTTDTLLRSPTIQNEMTLAIIGLDFVDTDGSSRALLVAGGTNATLANCRFLNNTSIASGGAALYSTGQELFIDGCLFAENEGVNGPAFYFIQPERVRITNSFFSENRCQLDGGAGYMNQPKFPTISNSTFDHNLSFTNRGGALHTDSWYMPLRLTQVTFSQNQSIVEGGAIYCNADALVPIVMTHCTFVGNIGFTGAVLAMEMGDKAILSGNLFFRNQDLSGNPNAFALIGVGEVLSEGHNLIDADDLELDHPNDIRLPGQDLHLGPLTWNGGPVPTFHPLVASPALDRINLAGGHCLPLADARGIQRPQDSDAYLPNPEAMDIGAVEAVEPIVVDTQNDGVSALSTTLREAISQAPDGGRVIVDPGSFGSTATFLATGLGGQGTELVIDKSLMIDGTGSPTGITISAPDNDRGLNITGTGSQVALHAVSVLNGNAPNTGGGIRVADAWLTLSQCAITNCEAATDGGALLANNARVLMENVTLDQNTAGDQGGAIFAWNGSELIIRHSTISFNTSVNDAAGLQLFGSSVRFFCSVIAENFRTSGTLHNYAGTAGATIQSDGFNMTDGTFLPGTSDANSVTVVFNFRSLTGFSSTRVPGFQSAIVDAGPINAQIPAQDARGGVRKWGPTVDIGAFEMGTLLVDNDNDFMDDVWELYYGLNPGSPNDSIGNLDFDGASNVEEYQGMTDPGVIDVVAPPKILDWEYTGGFLIGSFVSAPGVDYNMWVSTDLVNWGPVPFTGEAGASQTSFNFPPFQPASDRVFLEIRTVD